MASEPTSIHNFRVPDTLWEQAKTIAQENDDRISAVIRRALVAYVQEHQS